MLNNLGCIAVDRFKNTHKLFSSSYLYKHKSIPKSYFIKLDQVYSNVKEKNFDNYLDKNGNLSKSTLSLRVYAYQLINKFVNLDAKITELKKLEDPDEEMEVW